MPASSSETRTRWKKRRREPQISRKLKAPQSAQQEEDVYEEEDEEDEEFNEDDNNINQNPNTCSVDRTFHFREMESVSEGGERISSFPIVIKRAVSRPHSSVLSMVGIERAGRVGESRGQGQGQNALGLENISHGQLQALSAVPSDCHSLGVEESGSGSGSYVITPPPIEKGRGVVKRFGSAGRVHVVPMHADWFSPDSVHRLERQVVPHFFCGKSVDHTPERYMERRNCIVAKYMETPEKHLSVVECRGLVADISIDDLTRIVRFLDHWGIINYCAAAINHESQKDMTNLCEHPKGDLCVPAVALKSIDSLIHFDKPKCRLKAAEVYPELASHGDGYSDFDSTVIEYLSESRCNCCSRPTPVVYYQSQKEVDVLLCLDCFNDGIFVVGHSSLDFVKVDSMKDSTCLDGESWTDQETLLLLEGMQLYNENWNEIAEHVGTKCKAECILHFVRLPVDGTPLENIQVPSSGSSNLSYGDDCKIALSKSDGNLAGAKLSAHLPDSDFEDKFPFASCRNPAMALVAFLASAVGPRVAAACAHASLSELSKNDGSTSSRNHMQIDESSHMDGMTSKEGCLHGHYANSSQPKDEKLRGQGLWSQRDSEATSLSAEKVKVAAMAGLDAAATKAKLFADHEEREIQRLSANIINHQLKRLELKLKQFAEVETLLMRECEQMERTRQRFASEHTLMSSHLGSSGLSRPMGRPNACPSSMVNNNVGNRQPVISNSSQPFISGLGSNQPTHPHMSLLSQQSMYGLGPRLPLSAVQPSPSPPNIMFNATTNSQSALGHSTLRSISGSKSALG